MTSGGAKQKKQAPGGILERTVMHWLLIGPLLIFLGYYREPADFKICVCVSRHVGSQRPPRPHPPGHSIPKWSSTGMYMSHLHSPSPPFLSPFLALPTPTKGTCHACMTEGFAVGLYLWTALPRLLLPPPCRCVPKTTRAAPKSAVPGVCCVPSSNSESASKSMAKRLVSRL
jgi:hypothetical protein